MKDSLAKVRARRKCLNDAIKTLEKLEKMLAQIADDSVVLKKSRAGASKTSGQTQTRRRARIIPFRSSKGRHRPGGQER